MTAKEALNYLDYMSSKCLEDRDPRQHEAVEVLSGMIKKDEEESTRVLRELVERDTVRETLRLPGKGADTCPSCYFLIRKFPEERIKFCSNCGQRLAKKVY